MGAEIRYQGRTFYPGTPAFDEVWLSMHLDRAPRQWQARIREQWARRMGEAGPYVANTYVRETSALLDSMVLPLSASDDDLRARADALAVEAFEAAAVSGARGLVDHWRALSDFVKRRGLDAPEVRCGLEEEVRGAVARMVCPLWWRRQLRRMHGRTIERAAVRLGYVHLRSEKYVSDVNVKRRQQQKRRNAAALADVEMVNQHGQAFSLADLAERSNANPRIRRAELMTRIAGFERIAKDLGHVAEFWTGTAPSAFHAVRWSDGKENPAWVEAGRPTARDGQKHLSRCWQLTRAWAHRRGIRFYGVRIAEPHHDGCPHWHLLLFMPADVADEARAGFRRYFLDKHEPHEPGAQKNRVKFVRIDMTSGSAAGYVVKYVSKNIDGFGVQKDLFGDDAVEGAARVEAWASTWGIRQFQQIGGAPVGVWRELRRLPADDAVTDRLERARAAADAGDWQAYVMEQGGPTARRDQLEIAPAVSRDGEVWCPVAGATVPAGRTRYGESPKGRVFGVRDVRKDRAAITRRFKWEVRRGRTGVAVEAFRAGSQGNREALASPAPCDFQAGGAGPWTRVNNCTRPDGREGVGNGGSGSCAGDGASFQVAGSGNAAGSDRADAVQVGLRGDHGQCS